MIEFITRFMGIAITLVLIVTVVVVAFTVIGWMYAAHPYLGIAGVLILFVAFLTAISYDFY